MTTRDPKHPTGQPVGLVTGATAGIGLAFARALAARGNDLVLVARTRERLDQVAAELHERYGTIVEVLPADLSRREDVERVAERLRSTSQPVEVLVNNAGFGMNKAFLDATVEEEENHLAVLVQAVLVLSHAAATTMVNRGSGRIVNVSSVAGFVQMGTYSAAKSWVTVFTEGLANELRGTGVTATALCPGFTHTEFHARAEMNMSRLPEAAWLDADRLVADCLADVDAGRVTSTPGRLYKGLTSIASLAPRPVVRRLSGTLAANRRTR